MAHGQAIAAFQKDFPDLDVHVVDNTLSFHSLGVNRAIEASRGEIIVRLDAHRSHIPITWRIVLLRIEAGRGDNIGGVWEIYPGAKTWIAKSIAVAAAHPLGVGDALIPPREPRHRGGYSSVWFISPDVDRKDRALR